MAVVLAVLVPLAMVTLVLFAAMALLIGPLLVARRARAHLVSPPGRRRRVRAA